MNDKEDDKVGDYDFEENIRKMESMFKKQVQKHEKSLYNNMSPEEDKKKHKTKPKELKESKDLKELKEGKDIKEFKENNKSDKKQPKLSLNNLNNLLNTVKTLSQGSSNEKIKKKKITVNTDDKDSTFKVQPFSPIIQSIPFDNLFNLDTFPSGFPTIPNLIQNTKNELDNINFKKQEETTNPFSPNYILTTKNLTEVSFNDNYDPQEEKFKLLESKITELKLEVNLEEKIDSKTLKKLSKTKNLIKEFLEIMPHQIAQTSKKIFDLLLHNIDYLVVFYNLNLNVLSDIKLKNDWRK